MGESTITDQRVHSVIRNIRRCSSFSAYSLTYFNERLGYAGHERQFATDYQTLRKDIHERLDQMIDDIRLVFMVYQNFSPLNIEAILRNAPAGPQIDNIQYLQWNVTKLLRILAALEQRRSSQTLQSFRDCLYIIYEIGDFLEDFATEREGDDTNVAERERVFELMRNEAGGIIESCREFHTTAAPHGDY